MKLDFDPLLDKQEWEDRPDRKPVDVKTRHENGTKLEHTLRQQSTTGRERMMRIHAAMTVLLYICAFILIGLVIWSGWTYAFS